MIHPTAVTFLKKKKNRTLTAESLQKQTNCKKENYAEKKTANEAKGVTQQEYEQWQRSVIGAFYDPGLCSNNIFPTDSSPSGVVKSKWVIVIDPFLGNGKCVSDQVAETPHDDRSRPQLPQVRPVQLWHVGKKGLDSVKYGYDSRDSQGIK